MPHMRQTKMETCTVIRFSSLTWTPQGGSVRSVSLESLSRMWLLCCLFYMYMKPFTPNAHLWCVSYILLYWKGEGFWSHCPYVESIYINKIMSLHITYYAWSGSSSSNGHWAGLLFMYLDSFCSYSCRCTLFVVSVLYFYFTCWSVVYKLTN